MNSKTSGTSVKILLTLLFFSLAFLPFNATAQKDTPCECAQRWNQGGRWTTTGTVNDANGGNLPKGIIRCGSSADTESNRKAGGCVYNSNQFQITLASCKNPDTGLPVNVNPPTNGCPVIWFNLDQRPAAGSYQYQIVSSDAYSWALYYSSEHQTGIDANGLSGDCSRLVYYACGNSFNGWATFRTPSFLLATNIYVAVWRTTGCGTQNDFSVNFKARYGCGDADFVLCNSETGTTSVSCNSDGTYTVNVPIYGSNANYQGYDANATPTTSNVVTLQNIGVGGPISGVITMTYPQSVPTYNIQISDVVLTTGDIIPSNPDSCIFNVTGTGLNCDDSNPQSDDFCENGVCVHDCDDDNACTQDAYVNGACIYTGGDCSDGNACTQDVCDPATGCSNPPLNCDDGNPQSEDVCDGGICTHTCDDDNACTTDSYVNGECIFSGGDCEDNDACTQNICNPTTGCTNPPLNCNDGNPQSVDECEDGVCTHTCNDNNVCTTDAYVNGNCVFTTINCGDSDLCTSDGCNPSTGCFNTHINCDDGNPQTPDQCVDGICIHGCDDDNACTSDTYINGNCVFTAITCNDGNACTTNTCNPSLGCIFTPINCNDGNPQSTDNCVNGVCAHTCNDGNACTTDTYVNGNCVFTPLNCDDGNPQSTDNCVNGVCVHTCDDGIDCTIDSYVNGQCVFAPGCNDNDVCTIDNCVNNDCIHTPFCNDDNNLCTVDVCRAPTPTCVYVAKNCSDNDACTTDGCNLANGNCTHSEVNCDDGVECTVDACTTLCTHDASGCGNNLICPPKMIIVLDESGSIAGYGQGSIGVTTQVRNGVAGMFTALSETNIEVAVIEFNTRARRAIINGTTAYQQITPANLSSFIAYANDNNTTPEASHFDPEDYLSNTTNAFTNWDDALKLTESINANDGLAPLVLFFTDGKPTAYNNSNGTVTTGTSTTAVAEALSRAVASANNVKAQGAKIFVVAFPNPSLTESYVQAISGPSRYPDIQPDFTLADYSIETSSSLENSLVAITSKLCRADLRLSVKIIPAIACPGNTMTFRVKVTNDGLDKADVVQVKDYLPSGYTYVSDDGGASTTFASGTVTWDVGTLLNTHSDSITITATVNQSGNYKNVAEVFSSNKDDGDSQPGNYSTNPDEDDEASATVSFQGCNGGGCTSNTECNDNSVCTNDVCSNSVCQNTPITCNDNNPCTTDACNTSTGCVYTPIQNCGNDPCAGVNCNDNDACTSDACSNGQCSHTLIQSQPSYLKVVNPAKSWRKLKLGYSSTSLYAPMQNVTTGGNNQLCITLRTVGTPEWSKIQIRPAGSSTSLATLSNYISGSVANFTTFCIPLSAFSGFNFSSISFIEVPYSNGANAFEIHIAKIEFTGGANPFLWFGDPHTNNYHDGGTGSSSALIATLVSGSPCGTASKLSGDEFASQQSEKESKPLLSAYPNPFSEKLNIEFTLAKDSRVKLEIFNLAGQRIAQLFEGDVKAGELKKYEFTPDKLSEGMFIYRLQTESGSYYGKAVMMR